MAHDHGHTTVVEDRTGAGAGMLVALAAIIVIALIAFAVLWTQPWDDNDGAGVTDTVPGIEDNGGGGATDGGTDDGGTGGGTGGGGEQPPAEQPAQ